MRLRDRVEIVAARITEDQYGDRVVDWGDPIVVASVRAQVGYMSVAKLVAAGVDSLVEELRAVMEMTPLNVDSDRLRWRGNVYAADGPPMIRRRNGVDHHMTVVLKRLS